MISLLFKLILIPHHNILQAVRKLFDLSYLLVIIFFQRYQLLILLYQGILHYHYISFGTLYFLRVHIKYLKSSLDLKF